MLIGIYDYSPDIIHKRLLKNGIQNVIVNKFTGLTSEVTLVLGIKSIIQNFLLLRRFTYPIIVFDSLHNLLQVNMYIVRYNQYPQCTYITHYDAIDKISEEINHDSFLAPFMTLIYTLPYRDQDETKKKILKWLVKYNLKTLANCLSGISNKKFLTNMKEFLYSPIVKMYSLAVRELLKTGNIDEVASKFKIQKYELTYIQCIINT